MRIILFHRAGRPASWRSARSLLLAALAFLGADSLTAAVLDWAPQSTEITRPTSLPAESINGTLLVDAMINGAGPFRLLIDTGCSCSVISPAVAAAVDARAWDGAAYVLTTNGLGETGSAVPVTLDSVELGGARLLGVTACVTSLDLQARVTGTRIDGLLGYSAFSDLFLTLDFPRRQVTLSAGWPGSLPPVRATVDLVEHEAVPFATVYVQGRPQEMMIDTGATGGLEFAETAATDLSWKAAPRPGGLVAVMGGMGRDWLGRLSGPVELGGVRQTDPVVAVTRGASRIGAGFFQSHRVVISRAQHTLWLCSDTDDPIPSPPNISLGLSLLAEEAGWRVAGTIPGSPAETGGIAAGDLITAVNHSPAQAWTRDDLQQWIEHHAAITLNLTGSTGARELTLPAWSLVP